MIGSTSEPQRVFNMFESKRQKTNIIQKQFRMRIGPVFEIENNNLMRELRSIEKNLGIEFPVLKIDPGGMRSVVKKTNFEFETKKPRASITPESIKSLVVVRTNDIRNETWNNANTTKPNKTSDLSSGPNIKKTFSDIERRMIFDDVESVLMSRMSKQKKNKSLEMSFLNRKNINELINRIEIPPTIENKKRTRISF